MKRLITPILLCTLVVTTACAHKKDQKKPSPETSSISIPVSQWGVDKMTEMWPDASKLAIKNLTSKYGLPSTVTEEMVVWGANGAFKRSIVYKEEVTHSFPSQHSDILQQTVDYRVPLDKVASLAKFDGSLVIDRTKGELSARNANEEMNILSLNLADKVVRGEMTAEQARREYSKNAEVLAAGSTNNMLTTLNFSSQGNTSDPDTMMQSQEPSQSKMKKTIESEEVEEVIEE